MEGLGEPWCVHLEVVEASGLWAEYWCVFALPPRCVPAVFHPC